jgi:hypothetical protein
MESASVPVAARVVTFTSRAVSDRVDAWDGLEQIGHALLGAFSIASAPMTVIVVGALRSCSSRLDAVTTRTSSTAAASGGVGRTWLTGSARRPAAPGEQRDPTALPVCAWDLYAEDG